MSTVAGPTGLAMEAPPGAGVRVVVAAAPSKRNPHLPAALVLSLATFVFYVGYLITLCGMFGLVNEALVGGCIIMILGSCFYVPGLVIYRRNSGKPQFQGFVLGQQQQQQPAVVVASLQEFASPSSAPEPDEPPPPYEGDKNLLLP